MSLRLYLQSIKLNHGVDKKVNSTLRLLSEKRFVLPDVLSVDRLPENLFILCLLTKQMLFHAIEA